MFRKEKRKNQFKFGRRIRERERGLRTFHKSQRRRVKVILPVHAPIAEQRSAAIYNETFYFVSQSQQINSRVDYAFLRFETWIRDFADELSQFSSVFPSRNYFLLWFSFIFMNYPLKPYIICIFLRLKFVQIRRIFEIIITTI